MISRRDTTEYFSGTKSEFLKLGFNSVSIRGKDVL
jgi:hypothetical protein